jgi:hypothetical protein
MFASRDRKTLEKAVTVGTTLGKQTLEPGS